MFYSYTGGFAMIHVRSYLWAILLCTLSLGAADTAPTAKAAPREHTSSEVLREWYRFCKDGEPLSSKTIRLIDSNALLPDVTSKLRAKKLRAKDLFEIAHAKGNYASNPGTILLIYLYQRANNFFMEKLKKLAETQGAEMLTKVGTVQTTLKSALAASKLPEDAKKSAQELVDDLDTLTGKAKPGAGAACNSFASD